MGPPPAGDAAAFNDWTRTIDQWRGEVAADLRGFERRVSRSHDRIDEVDTRLAGEIRKVDDRVDSVDKALAVQATKIGFYSAIGSVVGGAIVTFIVAIATKGFGG